MRLREQKGIAARTLSVAIGQNPGYIHDIECGKSLPSLPVFFTICEYLGITPQEFFDFGNTHPSDITQLIEKMKMLNETQVKHITDLVDDLAQVNTPVK